MSLPFLDTIAPITETKVFPLIVVTFTSTISTASGWTFPSSSQDIIHSRYNRKTIFVNIEQEILMQVRSRISRNSDSGENFAMRRIFFCFQVAVNPELKVGEMSFDNNAAICRLLYTETFATVHSCIMGRPWHDARTIAGIFLAGYDLRGERFISSALALTGHDEQEATHCDLAMYKFANEFHSLETELKNSRSIVPD